MDLPARLAAMPPGERAEFCRQVLNSLSDLVERHAPEELRRRVEAIYSGSVPFRVLCDTLSRTIDMARACGEDPASVVDERAFDVCVERVRRCLRSERDRVTDERA